MKTIKFLLTTIAVLLGSVMANAYDFEEDGIYYDILSSTDLTAEVTHGDNKYTGDVIIPSTVTYGGSIYNVTSIGFMAFLDCSSLTSITIPESVTSIGEYAFGYCSSLTSVTIPNSVTSIGSSAFYNCSKLTSVTIGNSVTSIGSYVFSRCSSLTSVTIPNNVTSIGKWAFQGCSSLTSVTIPDSVTSIGSSAFSSCSSLTSVTIPNSVTSIGSSAFSSCSSLTSVTIPNSVTSIKEYTFAYCSSLTSVTIPNSVTSIGEWAFYYCSSLTSITIPNSVTEVGGGIFYGCSHLESIVLSENITSLPSCDSEGRLRGFFEGCKSLTSVTIPNSVTSIGDYAFRNCSSLTSIIVGADNKTYDSRENCNAIIETASNTLIAGCQKTIIPNNVTSIGKWAFADCSSLTSITIPNSVTSIGYAAFYGCSALDSIVWNAKNCADVSAIKDAPFDGITSQIKSFTFGDAVEYVPAYLCYGMEKLTNVTLSNKVKKIGTSAFEGCARLAKISLGTGLEEIAANAFAGCTRLYDIYVYATYPPFADESSFANYNVYVYIPCEYQRDYILDVVWGKFKFIECIDSEEVTTDDVVVTPGTNDVTITWPTEGNADTYTIVIKKGNEVFCTLTFNADGQLLNIAFAPGRDGNRPAQYAEQAVNGYRFTVTGLEEGTDYTYDITVKDASNKTIKSHSGKFTTESLTAVENTHIQSPISNCQKFLRNGQLIILRDGVEYNAVGQEL